MASAYDLFLGLLVPTTFSETSNDQEQELPLDYFPHFSRQLGSQSWSSVTAGTGHFPLSRQVRSWTCLSIFLKHHLRSLPRVLLRQAKLSRTKLTLL